MQIKDDLLIWEAREYAEYERNFFPDPVGSEWQFVPPAKLRITADEPRPRVSWKRVLAFAAYLATVIWVVWFMYVKL